jgi:glycosyltransferase involved in cell wall biosynthesis
MGKIKEDRISVLEIIGTASRGGMENYIINFIKNLPPDRFKVTCICPNESLFTKALRELSVEDVFITPLADDPEWRSIQLALEVVRLHQVDVLHAHMPKSHVLAGIAGSLSGKPVVATLHGMHVTAHELGVARAVKSHLITNCQETYFQALALGLPVQRLNLFHNGVDVNAFNPANDGKKFRKALQVLEGCVLVGFVGRLEHEKGPDLFLQIAAMIHNLLPDIRFAMVGDGSMLKELKKVAFQSGLEQNIHFVDWIADTTEAYPAFDLIVHTSRNDGTSLVLLEAMASGCPVAGLAIGGVREIIEDAHTGLLAEINALHELAAGIVDLLEQPARLKAMGEAGRMRVKEYFNVLTNTARTATLLRKVVLGDKKIHDGGNHNFSQNTNGIAQVKKA